MKVTGVEQAAHTGVAACMEHGVACIEVEKSGEPQKGRAEACASRAAAAPASFWKTRARGQQLLRTTLVEERRCEEQAAFEARFDGAEGKRKAWKASGRWGRRRVQEGESLRCTATDVPTSELASSSNGSPLHCEAGALVELVGGGATAGAAQEGEHGGQAEKKKKVTSSSTSSKGHRSLLKTAALPVDAILEFQRPAADGVDDAEDSFSQATTAVTIGGSPQAGGISPPASSAATTATQVESNPSIKTIHEEADVLATLPASPSVKGNQAAIFSWSNRAAGTCSACAAKEAAAEAAALDTKLPSPPTIAGTVPAVGTSGIVAAAVFRRAEEGGSAKAGVVAAAAAVAEPPVAVHRGEAAAGAAREAVEEMAQICDLPGEGAETKKNGDGTLRPAGEGTRWGGIQEATGGRGGWTSSRSANESHRSWQALAARHSIESSLSMLRVRSGLSADEGAGPASLQGDAWTGASVPPVPEKVPSRELLAERERKKNNRFIFFVFSIMFLLEIFVNFDSGVIPAILVTLQKSFVIDGAAAGLLGSLPYIGLVVSSPFVGRGLTTFSPKWFCLITMIVNLFATGLLGLAVQKWMLFLSRLLIGLSQAGFSIYAPVWVDQFAPADKLTLWMGLTQGGVVVGTMLGCVIAGTFDSAGTGKNADSNWRYALLVQAIGLFLLLAVWLLLPRRFVDINMQQVKAVDKSLDVSLEKRTAEETAVEAEEKEVKGDEKEVVDEEKEEEEPTTGAGASTGSSRRAEATTVGSPLGIGNSPAAAEEEQQQDSQHQEGAQQRQRPRSKQQEPVFVVSLSSEDVQQKKDVEMVVVSEAEGRGAPAARAAERREVASAAVTPGQQTDERHSAIIGTDERGGGVRGAGAGGERRWSALVGTTSAALFSKKGSARPATAAAASGTSAAASASAETAAAGVRPSSQALTDEVDTVTAARATKKRDKSRVLYAPRRMQSIEATASSEDLPQFRKEFLSNLLPLDFIATSPTFARRSSQLHPGPAPGAAAAAAAPGAGAAPSSSSSSRGASSASASSVGSSRKELLPLNGGGREAMALSRRRSGSSMLGLALKGERRAESAGGETAAAAMQRTQRQLLTEGRGGGSCQRALVDVGEEGGGAGGGRREDLPSSFAAAAQDTYGGGGIEDARASIEFLPAPTGKAVSESTASPEQQQPRHQRGHFLLSLIGRPATAKGAAAAGTAAGNGREGERGREVAEEQRRASSAPCVTGELGVRTAGGDSANASATAAIFETAPVAVEKRIPGSADFSRRSSESRPRDGSSDSASPRDAAGGGRGEGGGGEAGSKGVSGTSQRVSFLQPLASAGDAGTAAAGGAAAAAHPKRSAAAAAAGEGRAVSAGREAAGACGGSGRRGSATSSGCSVHVAAVAQQLQQQGGARGNGGDGAAAVEGGGGRVIPSAGAGTMPVAAAPGGGASEIQYQRIFMTPHASTLALEALNWAAGVGDPLLLVRDDGRHHSVGKGTLSNSSGASLGVCGAAATNASPATGGAAAAVVRAGGRRRSTVTATTTATTTSGGLFLENVGRAGSGVAARTARIGSAASPEEIAAAAVAASKEEAGVRAGLDSGAAAAAGEERGRERVAAAGDGAAGMREKEKEKRKLFAEEEAAAAGERAAENLQGMGDLEEGRLGGGRAGEGEKNETAVVAVAAASELDAGEQQQLHIASAVLTVGACRSVITGAAPYSGEGRRPGAKGSTAAGSFSVN